MEVSHFELLFKPQSPASPPGTNVDRVIQGYFLEITNLEPVEYLYRLEFIAVPPTPFNEFRSLSGNTLVFVDTPGTDNAPGVLSGGPTTFRIESNSNGGLIRVAPFATALVAVLPSAFGPNLLDPTPLPLPPTFEVRGYVRITLPALRKPNPQSPFLLPFFRTAQSKNPVRVLLTPQNRATFFKADNTISGQVQASLPLASGKALNSITPEPGGPIVLLSLAADKLPNVADFLDKNPDMVTSEMLAGLLSQVDPSDENLKTLNEALAAAKIQLSVGKA